MNHNCHGDILLINRQTYYRCFYDSTLINITDEPHVSGKECPNCKRTIKGELKEKLCKTRTIEQFQIVSDSGNWYDYDQKKVIFMKESIQ